MTSPCLKFKVIAIVLLKIIFSIINMMMMMIPDGQTV